MPSKHEQFTSEDGRADCASVRVQAAKFAARECFEGRAGCAAVMDFRARAVFREVLSFLRFIEFCFDIFLSFNFNWF